MHLRNFLSLAFLLLLTISTLQAQTWEPVGPFTTSQGLSSAGDYIRGIYFDSNNKFYYQTEEYVGTYDGTTWAKPVPYKIHGATMGTDDKLYMAVQVVSSLFIRSYPTGTLTPNVTSSTLHNVDVERSANGSVMYMAMAFSDNSGAAIQQYNGTNWTWLGSFPGSYNKIKLTNTGTLYSFYVDYPSNVMHLEQYGGTPNNWITIPAPAVQGSNCLFEIDRNGVPYIGYRNSAGYHILKFDGTNWTEVGLFLCRQMCTFGFDQTNTLYVAYDDVINYATSLEGRLSVQKYNGSTWSYVGKQRFSSGMAYGDDRLSGLAFNNSNTPYVYYFDQITRRSMVRYFDGTDWVDPKPTSFTSSGIGRLTVKVSKSDIAYAATTTTVRQNIANQWSTLGDGPVDNNVSGLRLELDNNDVPTVAYVDQDDGNKIKVKKYISGSWTTIGSSVTNTSEVPYAIAFDNTNTPYIAYLDGTYVYVKKFDGSNWVFVGTYANASTYEDSHVDMAIDASGNIYIASLQNLVTPRVNKYNGTSWITLGGGIPYSTNFSFSLDKSTGRLYMAAAGYAGKASVYQYDGTGWVAVGTTEFTTSAVDGEIDLAASPNGVLYLAYRNIETDSSLVLHRYNNQIWQTLTTPYQTPRNSLIDITLDGNNKLYVGSMADKLGTLWRSTNCNSAASGDLTLQNTPACVNGSGKFFNLSTNSGLGMSLQWQVDRGSGFVNINDNAVYTGAHSLSLKIATHDSLNGYQFRCVSTTCSGTTFISSIGTLVTNSPSAITTQPVATLNGCTTSINTISITATGTPNTYQWQINMGAGFVSITNDAHYSGTQTNSLTITDPTTNLNNKPYRCVVSNPCSSNINSSSTILYVDPSNSTTPSILSQPVDKYSCTGNQAVLNVSGFSSGNTLTYQWQINTGSGFNNMPATAPYTNTTQDNLIINPVTAAMNGHQFRCIVGTKCGPTVTSTAAMLYVDQSVSITSQPDDRYVCNNGSTTIGIAVNTHSQTASYQWQVDQGSGFTNLTNTAPYSLVTSYPLTITNATTSMNGYKYRCLITVCGSTSVTTNTSTLYVGASPVISAQPATTNICNGNNTSFTVVATGGPTLTYQWQVNTGSTYSNITNSAVYSGATSATLNITGATTTMNGYLYRCQVKTSCPTISIFSSGATLGVGSSSITIATHPQNKSSCEGGNTSFSVTSSSGSLAYQWQVNQGSGFNNLSDNATYSGATSATLNLTAVNAGMNAYTYRCVLSSAASCASAVNSNSASLTVSASAVPVITSQPVDVNTCGGNTNTISVVATGSGITYQWQIDQGGGFTNLMDNGTYSGSTSATLMLFTIPVPMNGYKYRCIVNNSCNSQVISNTALLTVGSGSLYYTTQPSNKSACTGGNTTFTVALSGGGVTYEWYVNTGSGFTLVADDATYSGSNTATLTLSGITSGMNNYIYRCVADNICTAPVTSSQAILSITGAPSISTQPTSTNVCEGENTTLTILSPGAGISYQWEEDNGSGYHALSNSSAYSGVTTSNLTLNSVSAGLNNYTYRCIVSNSCLVTISNDAILTVKALPAVSASANPGTSICTGASVTLSGNGANSYTWNNGVTDNVAFTPASTLTYTVTGTGSNSCQASSQITVTVNSCTGTTQSQSTTLSVSPNPFEESFMLSGNSSIEGTIEILDFTGKIIYAENIQTDATKISLPQQAAGIYYIRIMSNGQLLFSDKIIKQ